MGKRITHYGLLITIDHAEAKVDVFVEPATVFSWWPLIGLEFGVGQ